jgi:hypothetical protein
LLNINLNLHERNNVRILIEVTKFMISYQLNQ